LHSLSLSFSKTLHLAIPTDGYFSGEEMIIPSFLPLMDERRESFF